MSEKFGGEIGRKYANINISGRETLENDNIVEHKSFSEAFKNRLNVSILFDQNSENKIKTLILDKIKQLEQQLNIKFILAGRDFPIHSTVLEGLYEKQDDASEEEASEEKAQIFSSLENDESMNRTNDKLIGELLEYKYILIDKGNLILTAIKIPDGILDVRENLSKKYESAGLKPLPMTNILHMSLGRMAELPKNDDERVEALKIYQQEIIKLRHLISDNPLELTAGNVHIGNAYDFITKSDPLDKVDDFEKI